MTIPEIKHAFHTAPKLVVNQPAEKTIRYVDKANKVRTVKLTGAQFSHFGSLLATGVELPSLVNLKAVAKRYRVSAQQLAEQILKQWVTENEGNFQVNIFWQDCKNRDPALISGRLTSTLHPTFELAAKAYSSAINCRLEARAFPTAVWLCSGDEPKMPDRIAEQFDFEINQNILRSAERAVYVESPSHHRGMFFLLETLVELIQKDLIPGSFALRKYLTKSLPPQADVDKAVSNVYASWKRVLLSNEFHMNTLLTSPLVDKPWWQAHVVDADPDSSVLGADVCIAMCRNRNIPWEQIVQRMSSLTGPAVMVLYSWISIGRSKELPSWFRGKLEMEGLKIGTAKITASQLSGLKAPVVAPTTMKESPPSRATKPPVWTSVHAVPVRKLTIGVKLLVPVLNTLRPAILSDILPTDEGQLLQIRIDGTDIPFTIQHRSDIPVWFEHQENQNV